jgi:pectate lyase
MTAQFYQLRVGGASPPGPTAPTITTQPTNRTVVVGQASLFAVAANGDAPLGYQWYFNTNTPLPGATSNSWTVVNAQPTDAGAYHVVVTNSLGAATSAVAVLTVNVAPPTGAPDGYATLNGGTTGGAAGPTVTVNNFTDFEFYVGASTPYTLLVDGTINLGGSNVRVRDNKTIIGLGTNATLIGDLKVFGNNNVAIRNLIFTNPSGVGDGDGLTLQDCRNIWVDHCTFVDCDDGSLDITHGADWVTVSWCHFYYTNPANTHRFSNLVGHSDTNTGEDAGKLHVTFHHNLWGQLVHERMPRVRFGRVHVFNNYYHAPGNNNCLRAAIASEVLVEGNYFDSVKNVWELYRTTGEDGKVFAANNLQVNTSWSAGTDSSSIQIPGTDILSGEANGLNPVPYAYSPDVASVVPNLVTNGAGAGRGPFAP